MSIFYAVMENGMIVKDTDTALEAIRYAEHIDADCVKKIKMDAGEEIDCGEIWSR